MPKNGPDHGRGAGPRTDANRTQTAIYPRRMPVVTHAMLAIDVEIEVAIHGPAWEQSCSLNRVAE